MLLAWLQLSMRLPNPAREPPPLHCAFEFSTRCSSCPISASFSACCPAATTATTHEPVPRSNSLLAGGSRSADRSLDVHADHLAPGPTAEVSRSASIDVPVAPRLGTTAVTDDAAMSTNRDDLLELSGLAAADQRGELVAVGAVAFGARPVEVALHGAHRHR